MAALSLREIDGIYPDYHMNHTNGPAATQKAPLLTRIRVDATQVWTYSERNLHGQCLIQETG